MSEATPSDTGTINIWDPAAFQSEEVFSRFERLRDSDPLHYTAESEWGPFWSVTRFDDIMAVDRNHEVFSSDAKRGGIAIKDFEEDFFLPMFMAEDPPRHTAMRKVVQPIVSPANLKNWEPLISERMDALLDDLPVGEPFDWVDRVSIELTTQMLTTLFDFPWDERRRLTRWSEVAVALPDSGVYETVEQQRQELTECLEYFARLREERRNNVAGTDLVSMLASNEASKDMPPMEYLGNILLLIAGGNDTTRNTMSASVQFLHENPAELAKLKGDPSLIPSMVSETIRLQTPLAHMRRTATRDYEMHGKTIREGDKVIMWYLSGNRDERVISRPNDFIVDRAHSRHHLSFGFGIHRCVGNRLAELQLRLLWEKLLDRYDRIEVVGPIERAYSNFIRGITKLPVVVHK